MANLKGKIEQYVSIVWCYILSFILIITTGGAWMSDTSTALTGEDLWKRLCLLLVTGVVIFILLGNEFRITGNIKKKLVVVLGCAVTYLYASQVDVSYYSFYFLIMLLWLLGYIALQKDPQSIWSAYVNVVVVLAVISLVFYLFGTVFHIIPETGTTSLEWGVWDTSSVRTFFNLYYEAQSMKLYGTTRIMRNCGMFSEAPMFNMVLCVALAVELFIRKRPCKWKCIIIVITIITTWSVTGFLFMVLAAVLYMVEYAYQKDLIASHKKQFAGIFVAALLVIIALIWIKSLSRSGAGSINVRTDHLLACLNAWRQSPMLGCGYLNKEAILEFAYYKQGLSVGFPYLLASGGIMLSLPLLFPYVMNLMDSIRNRNYKESCFETLFLMLYFFTDITGQPLFLFFIAYITLYDRTSKNIVLNKEM